MSKTSHMPSPQAARRVREVPWYRDLALWIGGVGVLSFSLTFPAIHVAEPAFGNVIAGPARALIATPLAALALLVKRQPLPPRHTWGRLCCVTFGAIIGYTLFSTLALRQTTVAHGAILTGMLPATTASYSMVRAHKWPSLLFRLSSLAGMFIVLIFAFTQGAGHLQIGDGWMLLAVVTGTVGYAEGGNLARELGGLRMLCWALIIAAPFLVVPAGWSLAQHHVQWTNPWAWLGLLYIAIGSLFFGLLAWYYGLARGGIARVSQLQFLQPLLTICWAALFLGEPLTWLTGIAAALVMLCVAVAINQQRTQASREYRPAEAERALLVASQATSED